MEIDDPLGLAIDTFTVASCLLVKSDFDSFEAKALVSVMTLAEGALRQHRDRADEANDRERAVLFPATRG